LSFQGDENMFDQRQERFPGPDKTLNGIA